MPDEEVEAVAGQEPDAVAGQEPDAVAGREPDAVAGKEPVAGKEVKAVAEEAARVGAGDGAGGIDGAAIAHLQESDPAMRAIIEEVGVERLGDARAGRPADHYGALVRSIVGQQLSTKAARAIYTRLTDRFGGRTPTPAEVLEDDPEELRAAAGLSRAKVSFLRSLAEHVLDGSLELDHLDELGDDEVIAELTAVRGLGVWSAHMFLMFHLQRPDVLAVGDLGIRRAVMVRYGLPKLPGPAEIEEIAEPWRPYRTLACRFLWRSLDAVPNV